MSDTLEVFGVEYTGVTGIKATDDNGQTKTYIRPQGTKSITANGTGIDVASYASVDVSVSASSDSFVIDAIEDPQDYGLFTYDQSFADMKAAIQAGKNISFTAYGDDIMGCLYGSGYFTNYTVNGRTYTECVVYRLVGSASGRTYVASYGYSDGNLEQANSQSGMGIATAPATISATGASVSTGTNTLTLSKTVSVTPSVTEGYVNSGTAGNSSVSLTASVNTRSSSDLTASGATVTAPAGYYASQAIGSVLSGTAGTPSVTKTVDTGDASAEIVPTVTNSEGYILGGTKTGSTVYVTASELVSGNTQTADEPGNWDVTSLETLIIPTGTATAPTSISGSSATVSTGTNTLTLSKTVSVTPRVTTEGWISSGTAGNSDVSLTASVTTQAAQTLYPSTSDQTITSGKYLTGTQTVKAVVVSGLAANKVLSGTTVTVGDSVNASRITSVSGSVTFQTYYTGTGTPSSSLGVNGDIYLKTS